MASFDLGIKKSSGWKFETSGSGGVSVGILAASRACRISRTCCCKSDMRRSSVAVEAIITRCAFR